MPPKARTKFVVMPSQMRGGNIFDDAGRWMAGAARTVGNEVVSAVKKIRPSGVLGVIPHPAAQISAPILKLIGLGKKKGSRRKKGGASLIDAIKKVKPSRVVALVDHPDTRRVSNGLRVAGLGRKRKVGGARKRGMGQPIAHHGKTKAGMIVQPKGTGFYTLPLSLNGGVMHGGGKGRIR